ncbi:MAG TPA: hypothetical protein ENJ30_08000 [Desulfobulbaceae bacterium]|nr:hypothetical protein [Desulfobulbaceae bacterium]
MKVKAAIADVSKAGYASLRDIDKAALISLDKNKMQVKLHYRVEPAVAKNLYAGAFLYDAKMNAINAGYTPTRPQNSPEGYFDVTLLLPKESFHAATIKVFLMQSGKVIEKKYFKCPFVWNGHTGRIFTKNTGSKQNALSGGWGNTAIPKGPNLSGGWGKQVEPVGHGLPIGLDPGRGP